uniref:VWFA domain-containing protein n=1 Tax=Oncorhynchus tshawytscha TaxID=74940 RepID=A0AAZ3RUT6_ONCTS
PPPSVYLSMIIQQLIPPPLSICLVQFNDKAMKAACFQNLVQANVRNKRFLKDAVRNISAKGITNYKGGFELAFEQLSSGRALCNKIIMLFTDGGEERAQEIFQKYNADKKVRIFTFSVGQHNYDKGPIQWMACTNKGYYYEIPSIGAIRINTQEYLDVLGRPMVKANNKAKQVQWTNVYQDAYYIMLCFGLIPLFLVCFFSQRPQNQLILGVMAIDVSLDDIKRLTPRFTFGPNGYYFAIDPNGYVLLHPNLCPKNPKFQEPVTLDFLDAELEDEIKVEIRTNMIRGETGHRTVHTLVKSQDERYIDRSERSYTYAPVKGTDYSLALVLPVYSLHYIHTTIGDTITQAKSTLCWCCLYFFHSHREYCKDLKPSKNNTEFLMDFNEYIDRKTPNNPLCNVDLVNRLLLDAGITSDLVKQWRDQMPNGVLARFVATDGGITRIYPKSAGLDWTEDPETYESSFYKRSLDNDIYIFTPTPYQEDTNSKSRECVFLVSRAVNLDIDGVRLKPAVVGVKLDINTWMTNFINATLKMNMCVCCVCVRPMYLRQSVCVHVHKCLFCVHWILHVQCACTSPHLQIGQFFGMIDPILMVNLVNMSLFTLNKTYDYQSVCDPKRESKGSAAGLRSVYVPTIADILNVGWLASAANVHGVFYGHNPYLAGSLTICLFVCVHVCCARACVLRLCVRAVCSTADTDDEIPDMSKESCITEQTQYFYDNEEKSFRGTLDCENCSRMFHAEKLWKTNLVFVIADAKLTCMSCDHKPLIQAEQPSEGPDPCEMAEKPRFRKGPDACFDNNERVGHVIILSSSVFKNGNHLI